MIHLIIIQMLSVLTMSTATERDIHVVNMDVETIAVIKKNKKIQHERMRQGNVRIIVIHPFVFGLIIFFLCLSKVMDGMYNIVHNPEIFILEKV